MAKRAVLILFTVFLLFLAPFEVIAGGASTSGKTVTNLIVEVRNFLNEPTGSFWSDTEITTWLNDAVRSVNRQTLSTEAREKFVVDSGTSEYAMTETYLMVKGATLQTGVTAYKALFRGKAEDVGHVNKDEPTYFYEFNGKVGIYPLKDTSDFTSTGTTLYVSYVPYQSTLSGSSTIPTPAILDRAIVYYAVAQALYKDKRFNSGNLFIVQHYQDLKFYIENIVSRQPDPFGREVK